MTKLIHKNKQVIDPYLSTDTRFSRNGTAFDRTVYGTKNQATTGVNGSKMLTFAVIYLMISTVMRHVHG